MGAAPSVAAAQGLSPETLSALNALPDAAKAELTKIADSMAAAPGAKNSSADSKTDIDFVAKMFGRCAGADGKMDQKELASVLLSASANGEAGGKVLPRPANAAQLMKQYDADGSGKLNLDEFRGVYAALFPPSQKALIVGRSGAPSQRRPHCVGQGAELKGKVDRCSPLEPTKLGHGGRLRGCGGRCVAGRRRRCQASRP